jgi:3'-5' exoribonuclease
MHQTDPARLAAAPTPKIFITELPEGKETVTYFLCAEKETATDRNGKQFLRLKFRDSSGELKAIHFDPSDEALAVAAGDVVKAGGTFSVHAQYGPQFQVRRLRRLEEGEYDRATLIPVSPVPLPELRDRLTRLVASVADRDLLGLLQRALDAEREPGATFALVPAAVTHHHAYMHGLLEHSVIVAEVAAQVAGSFPTVNRDLTVAGALLHDIGKTQAYSTDLLEPGLTDAGRLHGEIVLGHDIVRGLVAELPGFPEEIGSQLRHIIVAHHGEREKGSPVVPMTREAIIVHYCDDMCARVGAFDDTERAAAEGDRWSAFNRMLETKVYLPPRDAQE